NLEVLKRRAGRADPDSQEAVQRYLGVLSTELERVNRRIELLLRLSRPGRGAEPTSLDDLAAELLELIQLEARHHELEVDYLPGPTPVRVMVPREPARQAILNLVLETIDRLGEGGTLRIRTGERDGWSLLAVGGAGVPAWTPEGEAECGRLAAARALAAGFGGHVYAEPGDADGPALVLSLPVARG
ncbi:MAG TPA: hypothetical protein VEW03_11440, partial [Longimicrobiaceae bacterium]|nr:hypothetical protein [Longimicrobiaceae bacterium]